MKGRNAEVEVEEGQRWRNSISTASRNPRGGDASFAPELYDEDDHFLESLCSFIISQSAFCQAMLLNANDTNGLRDLLREKQYHHNCS
jgi:hypothetical protein